MATVFKQAIPVLFVADVDAAIRYYTEKLGFKVSFTSPYDYAGVARDGVEIHIGKGDGAARNRGADIILMVQNIEDLHAELVASGAIPADHALVHQDYGMKEIHIHDPFGYHIGFAENV